MKKLLWIILVGWMLLSIALHILPTPDAWAGTSWWGYNLRQFYGHHQQQIQSTGHAVLMGGFAFIVMHFLIKIPRLISFAVAMGLSLLFAVSMEWLQSILPHSFKRECDIRDLIPGLAGAFIGCIAGLGLPRPKE